MCNQEFLKEHLYKLRTFSDHISHMNDIGMDLEGPLMKPLFETLEFTTKLLECLYEDNNQWIQYFMYECDFGRDSKEVSIDENKFLLDSIDTFVSFYYNNTI